jgi:cytoskeletal protein CcmA (bactofilin family)
MTMTSTLLSISLPVVIDNTLSVSGNAIMAAQLSVSNNVTFNQTLSVGGNVQLAADLSVIGNTVMEGSLSVNGASILANTLSVGGASTLENTLSVGGIVSISGDTFIKSALSVTGATTLASTLSVAGVSTLANTLSVGGITTLNAALSTNSHIYVNSTNLGALHVNKIKPFAGAQLEIEVGTLFVNGNLDVAGTYNTIDVTTSSIFVEDKVIILATSSNFVMGTDEDLGVEDGVSTNDASGIKIAGKPSLANLTTAVGTDKATAIADAAIWEKSLKWQMNGGMQYIGYLRDTVVDDVTLRDQESFWEVKGGALHLSADKLDDSGSVITIKYGFRINANDELEIIKKTGGAASKRVAKFGITSAF